MWRVSLALSLHGRLLAVIICLRATVHYQAFHSEVQVSLLAYWRDVPVILDFESQQCIINWLQSGDLVRAGYCIVFLFSHLVAIVR